MEPLSYNLQNVRLNFIKMKVIKKWSFQVGQITLQNENRETLKFSESMNYSYEHHSYWGQGNGMLKGLNTSITLRNKTRLPNINWGIKMQILQNDIYRFDVMLQPYTAMEVSLWTDYIEYEVPFMGQLFSNYADAAVFKPRLINGIQRESKLVGVRHDSRQVNLDVSQSLMNKASIPETEHTRLKDIVNNKSFITNQTYSKMKMQHDFIEGSAIKDNFQENQETLLYHFD
ncbi:protein unzipped [Trichogramma pretiosum]|uniref:protein unzipped n=1 Tax=Trichogramma pretiosum TaxID=7493 RepID=UPI000C718CBC|nr:protein unzipped [Trichogramma pretiosum]XP_023317421.1 protein unzipped [Trichogramma pretiosum]XP_023317422.1 protein unzipped [Trichogramma pretiosum]